MFAETARNLVVISMSIIKTHLNNSSRLTIADLLMCLLDVKTNNN